MVLQKALLPDLLKNTFDIFNIDKNFLHNYESCF